MFKIGDFSKLIRVSVRMLRYYDEVGLFHPIRVDSFTGYRYYSANQIEQLNLIVPLRDFGFNVADIAILIAETSKKRQKEMLFEKSKEIENEILKQQLVLKRIDSAIKNLDKEKINMSYNVKMKKVPSYKVISLRQVIPAYEKEGMLWEKLGTFMKEKGISSTGFCYATYYDEGYKEGEVDVEVVMEVKELLQNEEGFVFKQTEPIIQAAYVLVPGDFSNIASAFVFLAKWIEENGYEVCGLDRQIPIKGPWNEENPEDYLNEIQIPVVKE
ncbi:MAG: MerR family transcriptional regulator [Clostridiales bacterium]|nr:MerR family transcriptional regulator [Clostridiales bacterium]